MKIKLRDDANVSYFRRVSYLYIPALFVIVSVLLEVMMFAVMKMPFPRVYIFSLTLLILVAAVIAASIGEALLSRSHLSAFPAGKL